MENYGQQIILHKLHRKFNDELLIMLGYKFVPTHAYSKLIVDQQWITGVDRIGRSHFPRYHIIKKDSNFFIHLDWDRGHTLIITKGEELSKEIWRIKNLFK